MKASEVKSAGESAQSELASKSRGEGGFRILLHVDKEGYLMDEPIYEDGGLVPRVAGSQDYTNNNSFVGYRIRLRPKSDDPPDNEPDPKGCRLIAGEWYCP